MKNNLEFEKYFLGANSSEGFVSHFPDSFPKGKGYRALIIKGGPGTGKSSFMKYIAVCAKDKGLSPKLCICSSDPQSLDGVIISEKKTVILDGTAPHVVEPEFPGACEEIINLGQFWDSEKLRNNEKEIIKFTRKNKEQHRNASRYLVAAGELIYDNLKLSRLSVNAKRAENYTAGLCRRLIPIKKNCEGSEDIRFIEGITPLGVVTYSKTVDDFFENKVIIDDKYGGASDIIMNAVRRYAIAAGYSIITLKNPFLPSELTDHILIPELSLAFVTENAHVHFEAETRRIHARRFYDTAELNLHRGRMIFNSRVADDLILSAAESLAKAKALHDELEKFYIDAMDFKKTAALAKETADKILL